MRVGDKVERIFNTVDKNSPDFKGEVANHNHHDQYFKAGQRYTISKLSGQDFLSVEEVPNRDFNRRNFRVVQETIKVGDKVERIYGQSGQSVGGLTVGDDHFVRGTQYTVKKIFGHQTLEVEEYPEVIYDLGRFKRVTTKMTRFEQRRLDLEEFLDPLLPAQASSTSTFRPSPALSAILQQQEEQESRRIVGRTPQELMMEIVERLAAAGRVGAPPAPASEPQKKSAPVDPKRYGMGPRKVK